MQEPQQQQEQKEQRQQQISLLSNDKLYTNFIYSIKI